MGVPRIKSAVPPFLSRLLDSLRGASHRLGETAREGMEAGGTRRLLVIAVPAGAALLLVGVVALLILWPGGSEPPKTKSGPGRAGAFRPLPLDDWHLFLETNLLGSSERDVILRPQDLPAETDRRLLQQALQNSTLFDDGTWEIQKGVEDAVRRLK